MSDEQNTVDLSGLGSFDFTPAWAKSTEKVRVSGSRDKNDFGREERKPAADRPRKNFGERKPFEKKPFDRKARSFDRKERSFDRPRFVERPKPLDCEIKILPETKALGTIMRKIQGDTHAYKLKELAYFFLDNPQSVLLKILPKEAKFYQCKACGFASSRQEDVADHILSAHLSDYYDAKEIDCEPPKGNFTCVAKCGLSGVLLGPPNIHEYNEIVREMIRTRYPEMSEEDYRSRLEMVRDSETIEQWRQSATKKTVFFKKGKADVEGEPSQTRSEAEGEFKRLILPSLLDQPKHLMMTADMAAKCPEKSLQWAVNDAIAAERRAPYGMLFALRGAFHHRKMHFFRANDSHGPEFVMSVELKEFDAAHAIPELAAVSTFLKDHPCLDKTEFPADIVDFEKHLNWLVMTGHAVAFTKGVYSAVEKFPKYGPQWKKRAEKPEKAETKSEEVKVENKTTEPVVEEQKISEEEKKDETAPVVAE